MRFVKLDPPGTHCHYAALRDFLGGIKARTFLEVGVGSGGLAKLLVDRGLSGIGFEVSEQAFAVAERELHNEIVGGKFELMKGDIFRIDPDSIDQVDLAVSMMVMEHIDDDVGFIRSIVRFIRPGGHLVVSVPGRHDRWSIEDDTVGHLRRYERSELLHVLRVAGLRDVCVRSVSVPVANLLFRLGNAIIRQTGHTTDAKLSQMEQTHGSGIREIPFKTVFPPWFRLILNPIALYPLFVLQRLFYKSNLGLELMALARVPEHQKEIQS